MVKKRNVALVYVLMIVTLGLYGIYWFVSTKNEMNRMGAKIPTAWLLIIPIANIFLSYKYCEGFATVVKKDSQTLLWFIIWFFVGIIMPAIVQSELNKIADATPPAAA